METKRIFSLWLARALQERGHELIDTEAHRRDNRLLIFIFEDTPSLRQDIVELTS